MIHLRQDRDLFGPAEGILPSREAHYYLLGRFPQHHVFAATDLERYASCPFRFFLERVLEIEPVEDLTLEFDVRNRGRVVHDVLATFHRRVNERLGRPASPLELDAAEFDALLAAAVEDSFAAGAGESPGRRDARGRPAIGHPVVVTIPPAARKIRRPVAGF